MLRLAQVPDLGVFLLKSTSWELTESLSEITLTLRRRAVATQFALHL